MKKEPLVSICIPVFNGEQYLEESIVSALEQSYDNIEIIIADDCSSDKTADVVRKYAEKSNKIKYFRNQKNLGLVDNWNNAISLASGTWIKILFQDDLLRQDCIEIMLNVCLDYNVEFSLCRRDYIFEKSVSDKAKMTYCKNLERSEKIFNQKEYYQPSETASIVSSFLIDNVLGEPICTFFKKELFLRGNNFNNLFYQLADYEFTLKIVLANPFVFIQERLAQFRFHEKSTTTKNTLRQSKSKLFSDSMIKATTGDFILLLQCYLSNDKLKPIGQFFGVKKVRQFQYHLYMRACKLHSKIRVDEVLKDIIDKSPVIQRRRYNFFLYEYSKLIYKASVLPYLNKTGCSKSKL